MDVGIQSLWVILTVMVPGLVFYGCLWFLIEYLDVINLVVSPTSPLMTLPESETLYLCLLFAIMFLLQLFGIATESFFFSKGPYRHGDPSHQLAFDNRYIIISQMDPQKDYHVERILSQFFMSHNIAVGLTINLIWVSIFLFAFLKGDFEFNDGILFLILLLMTILSWYVSYRRFFLSCDVLYSHQQAKESNNHSAKKHNDSDSIKQADKKNKNETISFNLIIISSAFMIGSIGYIFGHFGEGFLVGMAIGFGIVSILRDKPELEYAFRWDGNPKDNASLKKFLSQKFGIYWANEAEFETDNDKTIKGSFGKKSFSLKLNDNKTEVLFQIYDGRTDTFIAKMEKDGRNIYSKEAYPKKEINFKIIKYILIFFIIILGITYALSEDFLRNSGDLDIVKKYMISIFLFLLGLGIAIVAVVSNKKIHQTFELTDEMPKF